MYIPLLKCNKVNQILSQIVLISVPGTCGQNSRRITFLTPVGGFYLEGHVFSNHSVELNLDCQDQCALARECVSYNIGPKINNKMACELSNSDHFQHPGDLKPRKGLDLQRDKGMICKFEMYITLFLVIIATLLKCVTSQ